MFSKAQKRHRDVDIAAMQRYRWNPYKEALLNPISGPLVGVPTVVPIDTFRCRVKASANVTFTANGVIIANPFFALCNNNVPITGLGATTIAGAFSYTQGLAIGGPPLLVPTNAFSNAPYAREDFAAINSTGKNIRGRVVSACLRVCNTSTESTKNGVLTVLTDPEHRTLENVTADGVKNENKTRVYLAGTENWITTLYHPVLPEEVDGWVSNPAAGPAAGVTINAYNEGDLNNANSTDTFPGFMGIWWNGSGSQSFRVEMYVIAEYIGDGARVGQKENEALIQDAIEGRHAVENSSTFSVSVNRGDGHTGHAHSATRIK